jgi:hypothetical protein
MDSDDISRANDKDLKELISEWSTAMFKGRKGGGADVNTVMLYSPLIQLANAELTNRFVKRTTLIALVVAALALGVSFAAWQNSKTPHVVQLPHIHSY